MASGQYGAVLRQVRRLFGGGTVSGLAEGELLERFVTRRDEAAFEALVERLGPMVLGVCRRMLHDPHDAEDAFQATFLVLVKRARSIRDPSRLANWLYGVALKVATRARAKAARRRAVEPTGQELVSEEAITMEASASRDLEHRELRAMLDQEIGRLPESYRTPIVLCCFQGQTHEEAAARLRWPVGTVRSRMARGRDLLRRKLARRGVAVPAGVLAATLAAEAQAGTAVPPALIAMTARAAMRIAAGSAAAGMVPASAEVLMREVTTAMILQNLKSVAVGVVALVVAGGGAGILAQQAGGGRGGPAAVTGSPGQLEQRLKDVLDQAKDYEGRLARQDQEIRELRAQLDAARNAQAAGGGAPGAMTDPPGAASGGGMAMGGAASVGGRGMTSSGRSSSFGGGMMGSGRRGGFGGTGGIGGGTGGGFGGTGGMAGGMGGGFGGTGGMGFAGGMAMMGGPPGGMPGQNPNIPVVINDTTVLYQPPQKDRVVAFSIETGKRAAYRPTKGTEKVLAIASNAILALELEGPEVTQIAVFDPEPGRWITQDLKEPAAGRVSPIVAQHLVAYPIGRRVYAYSNAPGATREWAVLELEKGAEPKVGLYKTTITAEANDHLYVFSPKTGRWSEIAPEEE